jgi:hypothetical protein
MSADSSVDNVFGKERIIGFKNFNDPVFDEFND